MARRNDEDEIQERTNKRLKVDETKVSFTVQDFLDGRCTVADLAADALRDVESLVYARMERAKERLEELITRLEMEQEEAYEPPAVPVIVLALRAAAPPPAAPAPGGEQPRD